MTSPPKVLIVSAQGDAHATAVGRAIVAAGGEPVLFDIRRFPTEVRVGLERGQHARSWIDLPGLPRLSDDMLTAVWWRRPQRPRVDPEITAPAERRFALNECYTALNGMWHSLRCRWVNPLVADTAASYKPAQLQLAAECGLTVPTTLVTNSPDDARAFVDAHDGAVVFKALAGLPGAWRETRRIDGAAQAVMDAVIYAPVIFQEIVPGRDLRVTVVGDEVFAAEMQTEKSRYAYDIRMDMTVPVEAVELSAEERAALLGFMRRLGLSYGAVDFRRREDGELVFLEINPAGQFLYIEQLTGLEISAAMAALLTRPTEATS